jgi:hypothetical protein
VAPGFFPGVVPFLPGPAATSPEYHRHPMAVLLLLPFAQVRGLAAPLCASRWGILRSLGFLKGHSGLTSSGAEGKAPLSYSTSPPDLTSLPRLPEGFPYENRGTEVSLHPLLLFSISLLGKPPHSSIMSMATGKNLQSIPKKVSKADLTSQGPLMEE